MDILASFGNGLLVVLQPENLMYCFIGVFLGTFIGVLPGSSAERAGLRETRQVRDTIILGDIILAVNGVPVQTYDDLRNELDNYEVGDEVTLILLRGEEHTEVRLPLEAME